MRNNVFKALRAADDLAAALDENEVTEAISMETFEKATLVAVGTFGGGTLTWQITVDGTNWVTSGLTLTAAGKVDLAIPCKAVRGSLAGATTPALVCAGAFQTFDI